MIVTLNCEYSMINYVGRGFFCWNAKKGNNLQNSLDKNYDQVL